MKTRQQGFTLIELVVVIVLLGIIGAVATARFADLETAAADAVELGVAGEISSGSTINFAVFAASGGGTVIAGNAVDCATIAPQLLQQGVIPADITVATVDNDCTDGDRVATCSITHVDGSATNGLATLLCTI